MRSRLLAWACAGVVVGLLPALIVFAPASWLAAWVADATQQQLLLADAEGSLWTGSGRIVLSGGSASRNAVLLPDRLQWRLRLHGSQFELQAQLPCCLHEQFRLLARPQWGGIEWQVPPTRSAAVAQWPAAWLVGLGAPWNTLQPAGWVRLLSPSGLTLARHQGRLAFTGGAELLLEDISSRLSTLPSVGSYRLSVAAQAQASDSAQLLLTTLRGPLQLSGSGQWGGAGVGTPLRFRGLAQAEPGSESALGNLLNLIGRRQGSTSILNIG